MGKLKEELGNNILESTEFIKIEHKMNDLFEKHYEKKGHRPGLHASSILKSDNDFCYRRELLNLHYQPLPELISIGLKRIFLNGEYVHQKWQNLFIEMGISDKKDIEKSMYSAKYNLSFTPDAVIRLGKDGKKYLVEIKSMNTFQFKKLKNSHPAGTKQLMLYMYLTDIYDGFVLVEDKNDQSIKIIPAKFNYDVIEPYILRLVWISEYNKKFQETKKMPKRKCMDKNGKRAQDCPMRGACWGTFRKRLKVE